MDLLPAQTLIMGALQLGIFVCAFMMGRNSTNFSKQLEDSVEVTIDLLASKGYLRKRYEDGEWHLVELKEVYKEGYDAATKGG